MFYDAKTRMLDIVLRPLFKSGRSKIKSYISASISMLPAKVVGIDEGQSYASWVLRFAKAKAWNGLVGNTWP